MALWTFRMFGEARDCYSLLLRVSGILNRRLGGREDWDSLLHDCHNVGHYDDGFVIVMVPDNIKYLIYSMVLTPKFLLTIVIYCIGMRWLLSSMTFGTLIMNALALEFIVTIPHLICNSLVPKTYLDMVGNATFVDDIGQVHDSDSTS